MLGHFVMRFFSAHTLIARTRSWWENRSANKDRQTRLNAGVQALRQWCKPDQPKSRSLWSTTMLTDDALHVGHTINEAERPTPESPRDCSHLSFFDTSGMRQYLAVWYELLMRHHPVFASNAMYLELRRWCHIDDALFWRHARGVVDEFYPTLWDALLREASCIGNMHVLQAADAQVLERFARAEAVAALSHPKYTPAWLCTHPGVALYFVEQGWWPRAALGDIVALGMQHNRQYTMGCSRHTAFVAPEYARAWASIVLGHLDFDELQKAQFVGDCILTVGVASWMQYLHGPCSAFLVDVEMDVVFAMVRQPRPPSIPLEISWGLDEALRAIHFTPQGYALALGSNCPSLEIFLGGQCVNNFAELYRITVLIKRAEVEGAAEQYPLPLLAG